ncbi:hypothetical protein QUB05_02370 [Microcoleus sp. F10-C6]|uniref:hypothetical protein n=1 Tax=unclassified Microcoleus TaxID=2642155 RepID=UPI002FD0A565
MLPTFYLLHIVIGNGEWGMGNWEWGIGNGELVMGNSGFMHRSKKPGFLPNLLVATKYFCKKTRFLDPDA